MSTWLLITPLVVFGTWCALNERWRIAPIRRRHDHEALWMAAIPFSDHIRVDELLSAICDAFLIPRRYRFRLRPSDDVHTFYRRNMRGQFADSMEYVHLMRRLEEGFGLDAERLVTEPPCTVGTLVRCVTKPRSQKTTEPGAIPNDNSDGFGRGTSSVSRSLSVIATRMGYAPTTDPKFLGTLETWFHSQPEILVLIRYSHAAGSKDFEFFSAFQDLSARIRKLPPLTCVIAFRQPQLQLRGVVDDSFITHCLSSIPDGSEFLVLETVRRVNGRRSWFHHAVGESHAELREELEQSRGVPVAVGLYPAWLEETGDVISAVVPDEYGVVRSGVY